MQNLKGLLGRTGLWGILIVIPILFPFILSNYQVRILVLSLVWFVAAMGYDLTFGHTGLISLGHAAFVGAGGYASALLSINLGLPFWASLPLAGLICVVASIVIGIPTLKLKGHYLAIATLGLAEIFRQLLVNLRNLTGGVDGVRNIPRPSALGFAFSGEIRFYYLALAMVLLLGWVYLLIVRSPLGRTLRSIREDEVAAQSLGVNISFHKIMAFALGSFYAGLAGSLYAHYSRFISPDTFTIWFSLMFLVMVLLGGRGSLLGCLVGALIVTVLPEVMRFLGQTYMVFFGAVVLLVILFLPEGIVPKIRQWSDSFLTTREGKVVSNVSDHRD